MSNKSPKIFYGWWIVVAAVVTSLYTAGAVFYGFTAVFEPIADEMGWSYTQISLAASLRGMEMGLLAPVIGTLVDRIGPRRLIAIGVVFTAAGLFFLSRVSSLAMFYGAFILVTVGMSTTTMTVLMTAVSNWFRRKIGLASGIAICGFGLGGLLVPVMVKLIDIYDWRMTLTILAVGMIIVVLPLSLIFRHKPEQYGYLPDGDVAEKVSASDSTKPVKITEVPEVEITVKQAIKSGAFWRIALTYTVQSTLISTTVIHVMPYLSSIGMPREQSSIVATAIPLTSIIGRIGFGILADRFSRKLVAVGALTIMGLGVFCFGYTAISAYWLLVPFLLFFSIGYGGLNSLRPSLIREYFGRSKFGTIFGFIVGINMMGNVIGPPIAGLVYDNFGSYQGIWFALSALAFLAIILVSTIRKVKTPSKSTSTSDL